MCSAFLASSASNPAHLDAMSVVYESIENAIGQSGIANLRLPARDR
jgi:hypothetical protein